MTDTTTHNDGVRWVPSPPVFPGRLTVDTDVPVDDLDDHGHAAVRVALGDLLDGLSALATERGVIPDWRRLVVSSTRSADPNVHTIRATTQPRSTRP